EMLWPCLRAKNGDAIVRLCDDLVSWPVSQLRGKALGHLPRGFLLRHCRALGRCCSFCLHSPILGDNGGRSSKTCRAQCAWSLDVQNPRGSPALGRRPVTPNCAP